MSVPVTSVQRLSVPARCVSHKGKAFVVYHKGKTFVVYHKGLSFVVYHKGLSFVGNATRCNKCAKVVCSCAKVCKGLFTGMSVPQSAKEMQENDSYSLAFDCLLLKNTSVIFEKRDAKYVEKRRRMCVKEM